MNTTGKNINITFFGESHGPYIGLVIDGLPPGLKIDNNLIKNNLLKRRPVKKINTSRIETDNYEIISGFYNGFTTGAAFTVIIPNNNTKSEDYSDLNSVPRPSHADYPASIKYRGFNDYRGGGMFSGRLTALWIVVGSIAQQILEKSDIYVGSHIYSIHTLQDKPFDMVSKNKATLISLNAKGFPIIDESNKENFITLIEKTKSSFDSLGGIVESKIINVPVGLGEPYFSSIESYLSNLLFSIPGVKGVEFGKGFDITNFYGSEMNDQFEIKKNNVTTSSNNSGGILGGLSNGMPILVRVAFKPTASIHKTQKSINLNKFENENILIKGRHDPQYVSRAVHVVTAVINFAILDLLMFKHKKDVL
ncbi:MAG: chorismate synthase [Tenericutes bacterium]|nr:chorismate synthase [Mycoplasmatota bacterium]